jgi:hypothetical protein
MELASTQPYTLAEQAVRDRALAELVTVQNLPLSFVTSDAFAKYLKIVDARSKAPTKEKIKDLINDAFQRMSKLLRRELSTVESVSLTADLWTAYSRDGYLGVTVSWINADFQMNEAVLALSHLPYPHTGQAIADRIRRIAEFWGINKKIFSVTTDGGTNMKSACAKLRTKQVICVAHTLNIIVQKGLQPAKGLIMRMKRLIKFFTTPKQGERLDSVQASVQQANRRAKGKAKANAPEVSLPNCISVEHWWR